MRGGVWTGGLDLYGFVWTCVWACGVWTFGVWTCGVRMELCCMDMYGVWTCMVYGLVVYGLVWISSDMYGVWTGGGLQQKHINWIELLLPQLPTGTQLGANRLIN